MAKTIIIVVSTFLSSSLGFNVGTPLCSELHGDPMEDILSTNGFSEIDTLFVSILSRPCKTDSGELDVKFYPTSGSFNGISCKLGEPESFDSYFLDASCHVYLWLSKNQSTLPEHQNYYSNSANLILIWTADGREFVKFNDKLCFGSATVTQDIIDRLKSKFNSNPDYVITLKDSFWKTKTLKDYQDGHVTNPPVQPRG